MYLAIMIHAMMSLSGLSSVACAMMMVPHQHGCQVSVYLGPAVDLVADVGDEGIFEKREEGMKNLGI